MKLEGSLTQFSLRELIEMIVYSSVTGALHLTGGCRGTIFFRDGRPYHAIAADTEGSAAFYRIFEDQDSTFAFQADAVHRSETLWQDPWDLIDEGERRARLRNSLRAIIPDWACVPARTASTSSAVQISTDDWLVLTAVDGQQTVQQISHQLSLDPLDVCGSLARMIHHGLVQIVPSGAGAAPAPPEPLDAPQLPVEPAAEATASGSFFDRLAATVAQVERELSQPLPPEPPQLAAPGMSGLLKRLRS